jgi:Ca2+/Na+ antiporter
LKFKYKLLIIWVAVMVVFVLFLYLRPFNEIVLLALVFVLGLLGIMLYTREHKDNEPEKPEINQ